jgi:hypothetical protein
VKAFTFCFLLHFGLFMVLFLVGLDFSGIDGHEPGLVSRIAGALASVLGQPALYLARFLPSPSPDVLEWALLVSNSLLWAAVMWALLRRFRTLPD